MLFFTCLVSLVGLLALVSSDLRTSFVILESMVIYTEYYRNYIHFFNFFFLKMPYYSSSFSQTLICG